MDDILIRRVGRAGRITLNRARAMNALTYDMCLAIEAALDAWRDDAQVALVVIDAAPGKAFCAGGDIQQMYRSATAGDFAYGQRFWADEYRMNAKIAAFPKPYVALMQGFTMGGGVGVSCHGSHRIVGTTSQIAMPECGIGLVPDVGGSYLLASAPGHIGEYLGITSARMSGADAIYAGFADSLIPEACWLELIEILEKTGDVATIDKFVSPSGESALRASRNVIDTVFSAPSLAEIEQSLLQIPVELSQNALKSLRRNSPLSAAVTLEMIRNLRPEPDIRRALAQEYRVTSRAAEHGDFIEGIRAAIIDKDRAPKWKHRSVAEVTASEISFMLAPLGDKELKIEEELS
ncbi:MAG: enoyl-CoA hydratase/isomerase family protein [Alphaproteobacteria bacterium]|nr:enoyl-CoA hydratase/isomerase family protein [Alphaproteobacteria bacterium]